MQMPGNEPGKQSDFNEYMHVQLSG